MSTASPPSLARILEELASLQEEVRGLRESMSALQRPIFRTPEEVAPELGLSSSALRQYCRTSGIHTRLSKRRIMLHEDDVKRLVEWIRERQAEADEWWTEPEHDPFA